MPKPIHPVKVELAKRGETQRECAPRVGVSPHTLANVINGHTAAWPALRRRMAQHFGVSEAELFPADQSRSFDALADDLGIDTSTSSDAITAVRA